MFIEKIHIDTFGKLSDMDIELAEGVNIIEGDNESGKSTLAAFIKFVLYGIPARERQGVLSWQTGGASGSLTLNGGESRYRVERAIVGNRESLQLIDADTNMPIRHALDGTTPGEMFFGVGADMFAATAFVSQLGGTAPGGAKVSEGIENILFSADESVNTQRALNKLDAMRVSLLHKNGKGGRLYELDEECAKTEVELAEAKRMHGEILAKEAQLADIKEKYSAAEQKANDISSRVEQYETRTLIELFARRDKIAGKLSELVERMERVDFSDAEAADRLEDTINKLTLFEREAKEAAEIEQNTPPASDDAELDDYIAAGGKAVLLEKQHACRTRAKAYTAVGIAALLIGLVIAAVGVLPLMTGMAPMLALVIGGAVLTALAVTLFVLASRARANADRIDEEYDFEELEGRILARNAANEAAKLASLASLTAQRRYEDACDKAKLTYGCDREALDTLLVSYKEKLREASELKAEHDKHASVLLQIEAQLRPYDEDQLLDSLDETIDISDIDANALPEMRREADFAKKMALSLEKHIGEIEKTLAGLYPTAKEPTKVADKHSALIAERKRLKKSYAAYKLAIEKLAQASDRLKESISPRLAADTASYMAHITGGKYNALGVGTALEIYADTDNGTKSIDLLSAGTQDAAYLCLRMALISLLYRKELPTVIYDEAFARQDDTRLANMLKLVYMGGTQSIIFTSNSREASAMRAIGEYKHIAL